MPRIRPLPCRYEEQNMTKKPVFGSFNQGEKPVIACFNQAQTPLAVNLDTLIAAMQNYVDTFVAPVWGTPAPLKRSRDFVTPTPALVFLTAPDHPTSPTSRAL